MQGEPQYRRVLGVVLPVLEALPTLDDHTLHALEDLDGARLLDVKVPVGVDLVVAGEVLDAICSIFVQTLRSILVEVKSGVYIESEVLLEFGLLLVLHFLQRHDLRSCRGRGRTCISTQLAQELG